MALTRKCWLAPEPQSHAFFSIEPFRRDAEHKLTVMKKILVATAALFLLAGTVCAQQAQGPWGIRAGLNVSNIVVKEGGQKISFDNRVGYHVGFSYRFDLSSQLPFAVETGLLLTSKGSKYQSDGYKETYKLLYLELPVVASYRFDIPQVMSIKPFFGFYYDLGLSGKVKMEEGNISATENIFNGDHQVFKRSDFGLKFGVEAIWREFSIGFAYGTSLMNLSYQDSYTKAHNHNFTISLGYNF